MEPSGREEEDRAALLAGSQWRVTPFSTRAAATPGKCVGRAVSCTRRVSRALQAAG